MASDIYIYIIHTHQSNTNHSNTIEGKRKIILCKDLCKNMVQITTPVYIIIIII